MKKYLIDGVMYSMSEVSKKYNIPIHTLYNRLAKKGDMALCVPPNYKKEERTTKYLRKNGIVYPENLIIKLIEEVKDKIDMPKIIEDFDINYNLMIAQNSEYFSEKEVEVISYVYKENLTYAEAGKKLGISRQRIEQIEHCAIEKMKIPYMSDYYLLGAEWIYERNDYIAKRKKEFYKNADELFNLSSDIRTPSQDKRGIITSKTLTVQIPITKLKLKTSIMNKLLDADINTLNRLLELSIKEIKKIAGLSNPSINKIKLAILDFTERNTYYV